MIYIIDDDEIFSDCIGDIIKKQNSHQKIRTYKNALDAINDLSDPLPDLIFLDVLLPGPDGFTFLNELASYPDTAKIPIILVSSLDLDRLAPADLKLYGVKGILNKEKMKPKDIAYYVERYTN